KADDFAGANPGYGIAHRILCFTCRDRNAADRVEKRIEKTVLINPFIDDESNRPRTGEREHEGIDPGDVIGQEKEPAWRQALETGGRNPVNEAGKAQTKKAQDAFEAGKLGHHLWFTRSRLFRAIGNSMTQSDSQPKAGARAALSLLLGINLFNYIDRYILAAVEPEIRHTFFAADDLNAKGKTGALATAFLISYMISAPIFGRLADRWSRWILIGGGVAVWSLASGATGIAGSFLILL